MVSQNVSKAVNFILFSLVFLASSMLSVANIAEFDDYWISKAAEAEARANASYRPDPLSITNHFNKAVHRLIEKDLSELAETNSTRRSLKGHKRYNGPCLATNPIDRCWRCKKNWANDRKRLAKCAKGFAMGTTGGLAGKIYTVTNPSDKDVINPKYGTLRWACIRKEPLWIIFAHNMVIKLSQELIINSDKTIDARGANVHIANGAQLMIQFAHNIIIHNLHIHNIHAAPGGIVSDAPGHSGPRSASDGDGITVFASSNIWIDHVSMSNCKDGLIDVIQGSTAITISNGHYTAHNDVMLFGASDSYTQDKIMQITLAFNHFGRGLVQRMPRCRHGFFHVVNNDYTHWLMYAVGGSMNPTIISQGNRYIAPPNQAAKEITNRLGNPAEFKKWTWRSQGDLLQNGATFTQSGDPNIKKFKAFKKKFIKAKSGSFVTRLTRFAGALDCKVGQKC